MSRDGIRDLAFKVKLWRAAAAVLIVLGAAALVAFAAVFADAALNLGSGTRAAAGWLFVIGIVAAVIGFALAVRRYNEFRVAKVFEARDPALGNRLTNAVQFEAAAKSEGVAEHFRREAIDLGRRAALPLRAKAGAGKWLRAGLAMCGVGVVGWGLLFLIAGDLPRAIWPRFRDPGGDHPPFSRLRIEALPGATNLLYGANLEVRARASGAPVEKLWLVSESKTNASRAVMFLGPDGGFFQTLANVREPGTYYVTDGKARSKKFPITIRYTPEINLVEVTTIFPEYTGRPTKTAKLETDAQALPEETKVQLRVASNRPLKDGFVELTPTLGGKAIRVPMQPDPQNANTVRGEFSVKEAVSFEIGVTDVDGLASAERKQGRFTIAPDLRPRLRILEPGRDAVATPTFKVPVRVAAEDDYAISRVAWLRSLNRSTERPSRMRLDLKRGAQAVEAVGEFDLGKLGVKVGDVIEYYFEGADNYPAGPNVALSRMYRLQIISDADYEKILRQAAARKGLFEPYLRAAVQLKRLAENARALAKDKEAGRNDRVAQGGGELSKNLEKLNRQLDEMLKGQGMFDIERSFRDTLSKQRDALAELSEKLKEGLGGGLSEQALKELAEKLTEMAGENEEDVNEPATHIAEVAKLLGKSGHFVKLAAEQTRVARMLERFWEKTEQLSRIEQMEVRQLAEDQRRVRDEVKALIADLPKTASMLWELPQYDDLRKDVDEFIKAVAEAQIEKGLAEASELLENDEAAAGYFVALKTAEAMDELIGRCNSMPGKAKQALRFKPSIQQSMGQTLEQILSAMGGGEGEGSANGYSMFDNDVGLYGPNAEAPGREADGMGPSSGGANQAASGAAGREEPDDSPRAGTPGKVRLQTDARFPLRYRELVGEYFRVIADSQEEQQ